MAEHGAPVIGHRKRVRNEDTLSVTVDKERCSSDLDGMSPIIIEGRGNENIHKGGRNLR